MGKHTNNLINESSPYLLQHAYNPVNWNAWNDEALGEANREDKLILVSIGYSSCHWCHVMEEESFEDETVAELMNDNYVCIKVDREERPDIDQIYMTALQLISGRGGWPLNAIALPDGRPIWAASYVPKENWKRVLTQIAQMYRHERDKVLEYAENISQSIVSNDLVEVNSKPIDTSGEFLKRLVIKWSKSFDYHFGGYNYAPKFPLPDNYNFLLRYSHQFNEAEIKDYVLLTLEKISFGGIFDHIGGGFARYSTDTKWHVPHFEKMLYDNAQLVSLYSKAYALTKDENFKAIVDLTLKYVIDEMTGEFGNFYSALDADSTDENGNKTEGAYYVWTKNELKEILNDDFDLFSNYYNVNDFGFWEHGKYVLIKNMSDDEFADKNKISQIELKQKIVLWREKLQSYRSNRPKPELDNKSLCSWNALMLKGFAEAYLYSGIEEYLESAIKNWIFIEKFMIKDDSSLFHNFVKSKAAINGFLEDYALLIDALLMLYQVTFDEKYLLRAKKFSDFAISHFYDEKSGMFYFTSDTEQVVLNRKIETYDGVIASSNSMMAFNLIRLYRYFQESHFRIIVLQMLNNMQDFIENNPSAYSNWINVYLDLYADFIEIAILGTEALNFANEINRKYLPNKIIAASKFDSKLPILKGRFEHDKTLIYICRDGICNVPVEDIESALKIVYNKI